MGKQTDDDLNVIADKRDQLAVKIQETYGFTKDDAEKQPTEWQETQEDKKEHDKHVAG